MVDGCDGRDATDGLARFGIEPIVIDWMEQEIMMTHPYIIFIDSYTLDVGILVGFRWSFRTPKFMGDAGEVLIVIDQGTLLRPR